jgi:hypothetical protein
VNFHVDHHTYHNKNFGINYVQEMAMNTHPKDLGNEMQYQGFKVTRTEDEQKICLKFASRGTTPKNTADSKKVM